MIDDAGSAIGWLGRRRQRRRQTRDTASDPSDLRRLLVHELRENRLWSQLQCALLAALLLVEILRGVF